MIEIKRNTNTNPVKVFAETFENEAYTQVKNLANYAPYLDSKIRIMPDAHAGKGCTVGTTMTLSNSVTPNLVGVDIGCGMRVVALERLDGKPIAEEDYKRLDEVIRKYIPSGFDVHTQAWGKFPELDDLYCGRGIDLSRAYQSLGTLGGGNHFIAVEVSKSTSQPYLIIHSGSRNLGVQVCKFYQDLAWRSQSTMSEIKKELVKRLKKEGREKDIATEIKKLAHPVANKDLAHLTEENFTSYLHDMEICQRYAVENRTTIAKIILQKMGWKATESFETIHNYIDTRQMILRKGAVSAQKAERLLIPINMRDGSLLCVGKGNEDWNYSAPHGAGRLMSRSKAKELLSLKDYKNEMKGIFTTSVNEHTLDEAPDAYKPLSEILRLIEPTVEVIDQLTPVYNFKHSGPQRQPWEK